MVLNGSACTRVTAFLQAHHSIIPLLPFSGCDDRICKRRGQPEAPSVLDRIQVSACQEWLLRNLCLRLSRFSVRLPLLIMAWCMPTSEEGFPPFPSLANGLSNEHGTRTICGGCVQGWQQVLNGSLPIEQAGKKNALWGEGKFSAYSLGVRGILRRT